MKKIINKFFIRLSFLIYRNLYNLLGKIKDCIYYIRGEAPKPLLDFLWLDSPCWHTLSEHLCHKASDYVCNIFFTTGIKPKNEYLYLLDEE